MNLESPQPPIRPGVDGASPAFGGDRPVATGFSGAPMFSGEQQPPLPGSTSPPSPPATRPAPLPKRPKGRLFVGVVVTCIVTTSTLIIWNSFGRYEAYGSVVGRVIRVPAPWDGIVTSMRVREGDLVRQGDVIAQVENPDMKDKLNSIKDDLEVARANLAAAVAQANKEALSQNNEELKAGAEHTAMLAELLFEESELRKLREQSRRSKYLEHHHAISDKDARSIQFALAGQKAKVEQLRLSVHKLKERVAAIGSPAKSRIELRPHLVQIETLLRELARVRERLSRSVIRAPTSGRIVKAQKYPGEFATSDQPLVELLTDGSLEAVIFLPQSEKSLQAGKQITIRVAPVARSIKCKVVRVGEQMMPAPENLARYYRKHQQLLPVFVRPIKDAQKPIDLKLGSEVRVPRRWLTFGA